jgi:hypothetical protein
MIRIETIAALALAICPPATQPASRTIRRPRKLADWSSHDFLVTLEALIYRAE